MDFKTPSDLGKILRAKRKALGLTQAQAAALCDVGVRFIVDLERGKETIAFGKLLRVTRGYGLVLSANARGSR